MVFVGNVLVWYIVLCFPCKKNNVGPFFKQPLNSSDSYSSEEGNKASNLLVKKKKTWLFHLHQTDICYRTLPPDLGILYHPFF